MSTVAIQSPAKAAPRAEGRRAISVRRAAIVAAPVLAGILATVGAIADPAPGEDGRALIEAYAAEPDRVQIKSLAYHFSYAMWVPIVFGIVALVRRRGSALANVAGLLGILGVTTMPGFVVADFFDSAAGREVGVEVAFGIGESVSEMWALPLMASTGAFGFILALPLAVGAAWRAGLVPWWALAATVAGLLAFAFSGPAWPGTILMTLAFAGLALALARIDRSVWERGVAAREDDL